MPLREWTIQLSPSAASAQGRVAAIYKGESLLATGIGDDEVQAILNAALQLAGSDALVLTPAERKTLYAGFHMAFDDPDAPGVLASSVSLGVRAVPITLEIYESLNRKLRGS